MSDESLLAVRAFRTTLHVAARLRAAMDRRLREDGLTTQQAALITVIEAAGAPSLPEAAEALTCTRQNPQATRERPAAERPPRTPRGPTGRPDHPARRDSAQPGLLDDAGRR
ncbi:hypothetical protein JCM33774_31580 [Actinophytocola sp. KF-1]